MPENTAPAALTEPESITNAKGLTFRVGDLVTTSGSKVVRRVASIVPEWGSKSVRGVRVDGSYTAYSRWMNPDKLKHA